MLRCVARNVLIALGLTCGLCSAQQNQPDSATYAFFFQKVALLNSGAPLVLNGRDLGVTQPSVVFSCVGGTVNHSNRLYIDAFKFTYVTKGVPPEITKQPRSQTYLVGDNVTFSVSAMGTPPLIYQWRFNGTDIDNATNAKFFFTNAQPASAGQYSVLVTNHAGSITSLNAVLTVNRKN